MRLPHLAGLRRRGSFVDDHPTRRRRIGSETGSSGSTSSGSPGTDAPVGDGANEPECDLIKPFGPKTPVSGLLPGGASDIVVAKRASRADSFGTPVSAGALNTADREEHPAITGDGTTLFFLRAASEYHIFMATRGDGGGFGTPMMLAELESVGVGEGEGSPVVTGDELSIYFASNCKDLGGTGSTDIYMATRTGPSQTFGNITRITELATSGEDEPAWISPDKCRLYLTYRADTSSPTAIYVAARGK